MNTGPGNQSCPADLHYPDPDPVDLPVAAIVSRGRRIRRRQAAARAGGVVMACAVLALAIVTVPGAVGNWLPSTSSPATGPPLTPIASLVAHNPPVGGKLTLLSRSPSHWTTVAWATANGDICWATYRTPMQGATEEYECPEWTPSDLPAPGVRKFGIPLPGTLPDDGGLTPWVGVVVASAAKVTLTFFGHDFSAPVYPVHMYGGGHMGVFMIWLRVPPGAGSYGSANITAETAYDASGNVIAQRGPWK
jgi:hypothetical protein